MIRRRGEENCGARRCRTATGKTLRSGRAWRRAWAMVLGSESLRKRVGRCQVNCGAPRSAGGRVGRGAKYSGRKARCPATNDREYTGPERVGGRADLLDACSGSPFGLAECASAKESVAELAVEAGRAVYKTYCDVADAYLSELYRSVEDRFGTYYREINAEDEDGFEVKLGPGRSGFGSPGGVPRRGPTCSRRLPQ